ncbi:hypothetical protein M3Y99_01584600 [Aphelenchoides fujianensis]|nr:hypothetical protein M3Y99_01584600 [Aphelenchoides fujianensis]
MKNSSAKDAAASGSVPNVVAEEIVLDDSPDEKSAAHSPARDSYMCHEELDDNKVFNAPLTGTLEHERESLAHVPFKRPPHRFRTELEPEDVRLVNELGQLSADQLMEYLRRIKDMACALGQAQEDQSMRGKFIRVFKP